MKKILTMLLILSALLSGVSCGRRSFEDDTSRSEQSTPTQTSTVHESSTAQTEDATVQTDDITQSQTAEPSETAQTYESEAVTDADEYGDGWLTATLSEQIMADDENWTFTGWNTPLYYDGYAGSAESGSGFILSSKQYVGATRTYKFEFELHTPSVSNSTDAAVDKTLFVGLRRQNGLTTASDSDGVWISFKDNNMCILGSGDELADAMHMYTLPYGFSEGFRKVFIEDDQRSGVISVYLKNDSGKKELVCKIHISTDDDGITLLDVYSWQDGFDTVTESIRYDVETFRGGYVALWANNRAKIYVKNAALKPR